MLHPVAKNILHEGTCLVCGCTFTTPCLIPMPDGEPLPCGWANVTRTLCNNPECVATYESVQGVMVKMALMMEDVDTSGDANDE